MSEHEQSMRESVEDHHKRSGGKENLCENGIKVDKWWAKGTSCASVLRHPETT